MSPAFFLGFNLRIRFLTKASFSGLTVFAAWDCGFSTGVGVACNDDHAWNVSADISTINVPELVVPIFFIIVFLQSLLCGRVLRSSNAGVFFVGGQVHSHKHVVVADGLHVSNVVVQAEQVAKS